MKKTISLVLILCMVLAMMPAMNVYAADDVVETFEGWGFVDGTYASPAYENPIKGWRFESRNNEADAGTTATSLCGPPYEAAFSLSTNSNVDDFRIKTISGDEFDFKEFVISSTTTIERSFDIIGYRNGAKVTQKVTFNYGPPQEIVTFQVGTVDANFRNVDEVRLITAGDKLDFYFEEFTYNPVPLSAETTPATTFSFDGGNANKLMGTTAQMQYSLDGGDTWAGCSEGNTDLSGVTASITEGNDIKVKYLGNGTTTTDSDFQTIDITKAATPTTAGKANCTTSDNNDGKLIGVTAAMEYKISTATEWTSGTGNDITDLPNGMYYVRVKANGTVLASENQSLTINAFSGNTAPVAGNFTKSGNEDSNVYLSMSDFVLHYTDAEHSDMTKAKITGLPDNGTLILGSNPIQDNDEINTAQLAFVTFVPATDWNGTTTFTWQACDGTAYSADATATIIINAVNDVPVLSTFTKSAAENTTVSFTVADFENSYNDKENNEMTKIKVTDIPANGTLKLGVSDITLNQEIIKADLGTVSFIPTTDWYGTTSFKWQGYDGDLYSSDGAVNISITQVSISGASITMTAPVLGAIPQNALPVEVATHNDNYEVTSLTWNEAVTSAGKFKADQVYTATVTLTSKNGKKFQSAPFTPTVTGASSVGTTTTSGSAVGNTVSFTATFPTTGALTVSNIAVTTQPTKMSYTEGTDAVLALNGMQVTETNNDGSTKAAIFTSGTASGYTASPTNGTALTNTTHNGHPVVITHTASGKTASTANLTVAGQLPSISISDSSVTEGNSGTTTMGFTVSLDKTCANTVTVDYATANNTAIAGSDYAAASGTLTFTPGTTTQAIDVMVNGDTFDEENEVFYVYLSNVSGGTIMSDSQGKGTITDDDNPPSISINDSSATEGNLGPTAITFTVSLSEESGKTVTVVYSTANNTATAGSDYTAAFGTLTFAPGETTKNISVAINGDTTPEPNESLYVNLSNPGNAMISDNQGTGTIANDDVAVEATPAAAADYTNEKLTTLTAGAAYTVNGSDKTADASGKIAIENSWFGNTISLVKKGDVITTTNSAVQSIALAARPATPTCTAIQPTASSATGTVSGITIDMQYSTGGGIWTNGTGADVTGIAPGTVLIRVKATATNPASLIQTITITAYSAPSSGGGGGGGGGSSTPTIVTKIESGGNVTDANVGNLVKEGKSLTVEGKAGEKLVFDTAALKNIDGQTKDSLKVEIKDVSADYKNQHPDRMVVSLSITAGGKHITSFGNGIATVSLPYELKAGEKAKDVTVWYLAEDGTMSEVPCTYDLGTKLATFKVNHFSLYVVGTADTSKWTNPFSDVKESSWFYDAVRYVSANEMMQGTTETIFNPNAKTTRGMIVTILWRMENQPKATKDMTFTDVKNGKYYHDAVAWASEKGIVGGYSVEQFAPEENITREQLAVILHNYAKFKGYKLEASTNISTFNDSGKVHTWSKDAMSWANAEGLINGTGSNLLEPLGVAQRSQVATTLQRFMEKVTK